MSHHNNTLLLERALEVLEECTSHPSGFDKLLATEINKTHPDLDQVNYYVTMLEAALSQEYFMSGEFPDVY